MQLEVGINLFGGLKRSGKSRFCLKWANQIAQTQKVLFLNWTSFSEKLQSELIEMGETPHKNLSIYTMSEDFNMEIFLDIYDLIETDKFEVVVFDDIYLNERNRMDCDYLECDSALIRGLSFLVKQLNVKILLPNDVKPFFRLEQPVFHTDIKNFKFSHNLLTISKNIWFMYRPHFCGVFETPDGQPTIDKIEVFSLKNASLKEYVILFDNKVLKLY